ncbi:MAG: hypothetical protein JHD15_00495 [Phenylobacterium sp.]|uniref:hypothetical protein n=1 Tax=Phenylobacterium sp. TaxID=1871053 RepID=UPI001A21E95E|nr:hypothetical protein [Phenylobacterium sp.]MBJ7408836.1 hypothetical protein [Phenylobacterium sp.]
MRKRSPSHRYVALIVAAALHALLAALLIARTAPQTPEPRAIQVTLLELTPRSKAEPHSPSSPSLAASPGPKAPANRPAASATPSLDWRVRPSDAPEADGTRAALRAKLGCRTADLLALTKAERAACDEALAKGAETAPTYAVISPKLKKVFDKTFECPKGDVWCEYRIGKAPYPGLLAPRKPRDLSWDQD